MIYFFFVRGNKWQAIVVMYFCTWQMAGNIVGIYFCTWQMSWFQTLNFPSILLFLEPAHCSLWCCVVVDNPGIQTADVVGGV